MIYKKRPEWVPEDKIPLKSKSMRQWVKENVVRGKHKMLLRMVSTLFSTPEQACEYYDIDRNSELGKIIASRFVVDAMIGGPRREKE